jgi:hypothetical protein
VSSDGSIRIYDLDSVIRNIVCLFLPFTNNARQKYKKYNMTLPVMKTSPFISRNTLKQMEEASDEGQRITLNMKSLKQLLLTYGEYPAKYRTLIWRYVLCLPENQGAYDVLSAKGSHPVQQDLYKRYPIDNSVMFRKLEK